MSQAEEALAPFVEKFPDARVGYRGSLARGKKGAHKGGGPFDPNDFDVDAFIVDDKLAATVPKNANGFRNLSRLLEHKPLVGKISQQIKKIPGVRQNDTFKVRVFSEAEFKAKVGADEIHFIK